ncbi:MAG TPA: beta-L-arabinofuranosidase domain-containing protein [Acidobacteriaceae bacterium]|jgi:hypothetical protein|nr:beta-L-arabinofuranosidase domain-containing protein [Acidobacteriaceae bacterium]
MKNTIADNIGRRNFLLGSLATAATLGLPTGSPAEQDATNSAKLKTGVSQTNLRPQVERLPDILGKRESLLTPFAVYRELQLGSVRPEGWLLAEMTKQSAGITTHQTDFCFPFDRRYWASNERGQDEESRNGGTFWYPWEQMGYWADGAYRCAKLTDDPHLHRRAMESIQYTVDHPIDGWYLGPRKLYDPPQEQDPDLRPDRWPQAVFFRGLAAAAEGENNPAIMHAMCRHYLLDTKSDYQHGPYGPRDRVNIESILWCYAHSGDERLLLKAQEIWSKVPPDYLEELTADRPSTMHGVTFAETTKLPALLYMYTGNKRFLDISLAAMQRVFKYHMLPDGTPSTTESLSGTGALDGHETCDIVEFNLTWGYLLMATGSGSYGDRVERALFNAGMGAIRKDWTGLQYFSCPNQLHIARNSCQVGFKGTAAALYGPNSDHRPKFKFVTACCAGNVNRMVPTYVQRMWMSAPNRGLAAVLYGPGRVNARVGEHSQPVEILEETSYPFSEHIKFHVLCDHPVNFPLHLRIPAWCERPQLKINGRPVSFPPLEDGFIRLDRTYANHDVVTLDLPMRITLGHSTDGGIFLERGPLVYSLNPKEAWTPIAMPEFEITSPDYFPMWAATAGSRWNYGLAVDPNIALDRQARIHTNEISADPWANPPVYLEAPARRLINWGLVRPHGDDSEWFQTPPLPSEKNQLGPVETIKLVPLGSTHLRLTVFPTVQAGPSNGVDHGENSADI